MVRELIQETNLNPSVENRSKLIELLGREDFKNNINNLSQQDFEKLEQTVELVINSEAFGQTFLNSILKGGKIDLDRDGESVIIEQGISYEEFMNFLDELLALENEKSNQVFNIDELKADLKKLESTFINTDSNTETKEKSSQKVDLNGLLLESDFVKGLLNKENKDFVLNFFNSFKDYYNGLLQKVGLNNLSSDVKNNIGVGMIYYTIDEISSLLNNNKDFLENVIKNYKKVLNGELDFNLANIFGNLGNLNNNDSILISTQSIIEKFTISLGNCANSIGDGLNSEILMNPIKLKSTLFEIKSKVESGKYNEQEIIEMIKGSVDQNYKFDGLKEEEIKELNKGLTKLGNGIGSNENITSFLGLFDGIKKNINDILDNNGDFILSLKNSPIWNLIKGFVGIFLGFAGYKSIEDFENKHIEKQIGLTESQKMSITENMNGYINQLASKYGKSEGEDKGSLDSFENNIGAKNLDSLITSIDGFSINKFSFETQKSLIQFDSELFINSLNRNGTYYVSDGIKKKYAGENNKGNISITKENIENYIQSIVKEQLTNPTFIKNCKNGEDLAYYLYVFYENPDIQQKYSNDILTMKSTFGLVSINDFLTSKDKKLASEEKATENKDSSLPQDPALAKEGNPQEQTDTNQDADIQEKPEQTDQN